MTKPNGAGEKATRQRSGVARSRPIAELAGIGPVWREQIARWLEAHEAGWEAQIQGYGMAMAQGNTDPSIPNAIAYARTAISVVKQLAWHVRTGRGGPLAGSKPKNTAGEPPPP